MLVWVTRDKDDGDDKDNSKSCINITNEKPNFLEDENCWNWACNGTFCGFMQVSQFDKEFGFTPRKGSGKQYNLTLEEIK